LGIVVIVIGGMVVVQEWDFDITGIVTGLGLGGLAFALAAKDTLSNIFGLLMIITDKPFKIGDWIKTPHVEGTVEDIGFRSVKVRTFAQALVSVPNSIIANNTITNWSRMGKRRIKFNAAFTYSSTKEQLDAFTQKAERYLRNHNDIDQGTIFVKFSGFNDSSLDVFFYFFTKTTNWGEFLTVQHEVKLEIAKIAEGLNLSFAFPSQSIYMETSPTKEDRLKKSQEAIKYLKNIDNAKDLPESKLQISNEDL
jgi:MscS family membrane protein